MEQSELYELWQADAGNGRQNKDRPAFVLEHREAIEEHTDIDEPIPDGKIPATREWLNSYKGAVTRQLKPGAGEDGGSE